MHWILEEPGYEVEDRRQEVLAEGSAGQVLIKTTPQTIVVLVNCLNEGRSVLVNRAIFNAYLESLNLILEKAGPFWIDNNPHVSFNTDKDLLWGPIEEEDRGHIDLFECYEEGWFPVAIDVSDGEVLREAIAAALSLIDDEELISRTDGTRLQLENLAERVA